MIEIRHLRKEYGDVTPLRDVSTTINDGDVISIIGPSGTGKSTLLRCLNLLETPTSGQILVDGEDITAKTCDISKVRQKMGMVFQSFNLFGHLNVVENIMFAPTRLKRVPKKDAYGRAMELLRSVGLAEKALSFPEELSGGQKQRVAIARVLAMDPEIILFDEPTSALDPTMVGEVEAVIRDLAKRGRTMMVVTHEMDFARQISNRVFFMDDGGIYEDGSPDQIFENPIGENTRRFIMKLKVLELDIRSRDFDFRGAITDIEQYCYKNHMDHKTCMHIEAVVEELCQNILLGRFKRPEIHVQVEYSEIRTETTMKVSYKGETFNPSDTSDKLAYKVLSGIAKSLSWDGGNSVTIRL
ncbi:MAG: amino acid ABC transporter ATP-binding protein [Spirochaetales bacterium]|nr:amino acid ABC transporter ATP-binding protein [Spirochaetales bacterium]